MQRLRARLYSLVSLPLRAPLPAGGKKGKVDKGPKKTGELSKDTATGVAILKGQNDPPIKPDSEYPPWLFKLLETEATVVELQRVYEGTGLTLMQMQRLWRYKNKQRIKEDNMLRKKG